MKRSMKGKGPQQVVDGGSVVALGDALEVAEEVGRAVEKVEGLILLLEGLLDRRVVVDFLESDKNRSLL